MSELNSHYLKSFFTLPTPPLGKTTTSDLHLLINSLLDLPWLEGFSSSTTTCHPRIHLNTFFWSSGSSLHPRCIVGIYSRYLIIRTVNLPDFPKFFGFYLHSQLRQFPPRLQDIDPNILRNPNPGIPNLVITLKNELPKFTI